jgi:hypothetical protein
MMFCLFIILILATVKYVFSGADNINQYTENIDTEGLFNGFLNGEQTVNFNNRRYLIYELVAEYGSNIEDLRYANFDMNGDKIPELHLKTPRLYLIFTVNDNEINLWREDSTYANPLNNGTILYERSGGAPAHIDYKYSVLDYYGNSLLEISFEKYSVNKGGTYDENSDYFFEGVKLQKEDWDRLTEKYLSLGYDMVEWKTQLTLEHK